MENIELVSFIAKCCHLLPFMSLLYQKCWHQLAQNIQFLQKRTKLATFLFTSVTYQCQRLPGINCSSYLLIYLFHYINHYIGFSAYLWHPKSNCAMENRNVMSTKFTKCIKYLHFVKLRVRVRVKVKVKSLKSKLDPEVGSVMHDQNF